MINLPTVSSGYYEVYCRSRLRSGASRKLGGVERSSEEELRKNDGAERKVAEWERSGERGFERQAGGCGAGMEWGVGLNYRNRLEHRAAFSPLTLCSHALVRGRSRRWTI